MTMMGVTKAPEKWAAGVALVPFVNWFTKVAEFLNKYVPPAAATGAAN
jgi:dipeptidyl aminopeptidase/acylaminoacyl peptidase